MSLPPPKQKPTPIRNLLKGFHNWSTPNEVVGFISIPTKKARPRWPPLLFSAPGGILATGGSKRCITVSTLAEAEFYADAGFEVHFILFGTLETGVKGDR